MAGATAIMNDTSVVIVTTKMVMIKISRAVSANLRSLPSLIAGVGQGSKVSLS